MVDTGVRMFMGYNAYQHTHSLHSKATIRTHSIIHMRHIYRNNPIYDWQNTGH